MGVFRGQLHFVHGRGVCTCHSEGMTDRISVFFPEQNVNLTDLYTKFTHWRVMYHTSN